MIRAYVVIIFNFVEILFLKNQNIRNDKAENFGSLRIDG